jgi:hypothetical protein
LPFIEVLHIYTANKPQLIRLIYYLRQSDLLIKFHSAVVPSEKYILIPIGLKTVIWSLANIIAASNVGNEHFSIIPYLLQSITSFMTYIFEFEQPCTPDIYHVYTLGRNIKESVVNDLLSSTTLSYLFR